MLDSFATPWTEARQLLCPWDFPGKNTWVASHLEDGLYEKHLCFPPCIFSDIGIANNIKKISGIVKIWSSELHVAF